EDVAGRVHETARRPIGISRAPERAPAPPGGVLPLRAPRPGRRAGVLPRPAEAVLGLRIAPVPRPAVRSEAVRLDGLPGQSRPDEGSGDEREAGIARGGGRAYRALPPQPHERC